MKDIGLLRFAKNWEGDLGKIVVKSYCPWMQHDAAVESKRGGENVRVARAALLQPCPASREAAVVAGLLLPEAGTANPRVRLSSPVCPSVCFQLCSMLFLRVAETGGRFYYFIHQQQQWQRRTLTSCWPRIPTRWADPDCSPASLLGCNYFFRMRLLALWSALLLLFAHYTVVTAAACSEWRLEQESKVKANACCG